MENNHDDQAQAPTQHAVSSAPPVQQHEDHKHDGHCCGNNRKGLHPFRFIIGILVIFIGLVMLSNTMGWGWFANVAWWKLWPVIVILFGVSMLGRGSVIGTVVSVVFSVALLVAIAIWAAGSSWLHTGSSTAQKLVFERDGNPTSAKLDVHFGAGDIHINGGQNSTLASGSATVWNSTLATDSAVVGTEQRISAEIKGTTWMPPFSAKGNTLGLGLATDLPWTVDVDAGASTLDMDFSDVQIKDLNINAGATTMNLTLSDVLAESTVSIDSGVSTVNLSLPKDLGVRMNIDAALTSKNLKDFTQKDDHTYESANYATATKKSAMTLDLGVSTLNVAWR